MSKFSTLAQRNIVLLGAATLLTVVVLAGTVLFSMGSESAQADNVNEARVNELIERYIDRNVGSIHQKLVDYIESQQKQQRVEQTEAAFDNPQPMLIRDYNPSRGPKDALITIVDYSEFQCPFCSRSRVTLDALEKKYEGNIRFIFKHYPLPFHDQAIPAGRASYAAHQQGKFWAYHDKLFANQQNLTDAFYVQVAQELGLDIVKFNQDRNSDASQEAIEQDATDGAQVGVRGTPFFLINGVPLSGAQPVEAFERIIERLLEGN